MNLQPWSCWMFMVFKQFLSFLQLLGLLTTLDAEVGFEPVKRCRVLFRHLSMSDIAFYALWTISLIMCPPEASSKGQKWLLWADRKCGGTDIEEDKGHTESADKNTPHGGTPGQGWLAGGRQGGATYSSDPLLSPAGWRAWSAKPWGSGLGTFSCPTRQILKLKHGMQENRTIQRVL